MAVAVVTRHSPSRCLREIGPYAVILGERQQPSLTSRATSSSIATVEAMCTSTVHLPGAAAGSQRRESPAIESIRSSVGTTTNPSALT
jgi:hypothetical protein